MKLNITWFQTLVSSSSFSSSSSFFKILVQPRDFVETACTRIWPWSLFCHWICFFSFLWLWEPCIFRMELYIPEYFPFCQFYQVFLEFTAVAVWCYGQLDHTHLNWDIALIFYCTCIIFKNCFIFVISCLISVFVFCHPIIMLKIHILNQWVVQFKDLFYKRC